MKTTRFFLEHIHEQTRYLLGASSSLDKADFVGNKTLVLAFERSLEIIGEAVSNVDDAYKAAHPDIPWKKIRGLRNVVAHMYWNVDYDIIWDVVTIEIPTLNKEIEALLQTP